MRRRWTVRVISLLALMIVADLWVVSYVGRVFASVSVGACWAIEVADGLVAFEKDVDFPFSETTFDFAPGHTGGWGQTTYGFGFDFVSRSPAPTWFAVVMPMWLPCLLLGLVNWFVWRKSRPDGKEGGFPLVP